MAMVVRERRHQQPLTLPLVPPPQSLPTLIPKQPFHFRIPSPGMAPLVDCLSDLEKLSILGHGSGGIVYKVLHRPTASILALKVLHSNHDHIYDIATEEADILRRIDSPYVVRCHAVLTNGSNLNFAMEYMPKGSLRDILYVHHTLQEHSIAAIARQVLQGLNYLHTIAIVHGDINPSNLLVGDEGEVKIADFGSSRIVGGRGDEGRGGMWAYMSPERFDSEGFGGRDDGGGFAGDVWSLGVVTLECYLGRFPLVGVGERFHWVTVMCKISFGGLLEAVPLKVSEEFRSFVGRCLEKDWKRRGSVRELLDHPFVSNSMDCANINLGLEDADE